MAESSSDSGLTAKHIRAARALLAWTQQDLAKAAEVATSTVADFERGRRKPVAQTAEAMRKALAAAGIEFQANGAVRLAAAGPAAGAVVPALAPSPRPGLPIRWVSAQDLYDWADRNDGANSLPTLVSNLIRATHGSAVMLRFPADESTRRPGWDGRTSTEVVGSPYVPQGEAGWELTSQRANLATKARKDYAKRTQAPSPLIPAKSAYVFVSLRHWSEKDKWAKQRQDEGVWREVRAYDADDLVHWIELAPAVGLWLATRLNKRTPGILELESVWEEWSLATDWPLTAELVLSDRDHDAAHVLRWLRGPAALLSLQATTTEEVVAFFHATLGELPDDVAAGYRARCLVATSAAAARALRDATGRMILLLTDPDPGLAVSLVKRGHHVLLVYDERPRAHGEVRMLARPSRGGIASALTAMGMAEPRAQALARDCARNLSVLRRLIQAAPGSRPPWAQQPPPRALLAALLAGGWDEGFAGDKEQIAELAGQPYEDVLAALAPLVGDFDQPLQQIGSAWRVASPYDAWVLLAAHLTSAELDRFERVAHAVLGSPDPRFALEPNARWMAPLHGAQPAYSGLLRHGVGQVLILLALWGNQVRTASGAAGRADAIVRALLRDVDAHRWWSLSRDFRLLAEAAPAAFLAAIEDSLDQGEPAICSLFVVDGDGLFDAEHLSDLLWALESLAWSPEWLPRVTHVLARLDAIDTSPGRYMNRPGNSLRKIHLLWNPQTYATLEQRLKALDGIRKHQRTSAWKLLLRLLPTGRDTNTPSPMPRWRDFTVDEGAVEVVTGGLLERGAAAITERLLADVGLDPDRWSALLERLSDLVPNHAAALAALDEAERRIVESTDRAAIWTSLRRLLHHHREFPDAAWRMSDEVLDQLEMIYERFAPADALERVAWLFEDGVRLPRPTEEGWQAQERDVDAARRQAAQALFAQGGVSDILALARRAGVARHVGYSVYSSGLSEPKLDELLKASLRSEDAAERDLGRGLTIAAFGERKEPWAAALLAKATSESWGEAALLTILRALPIGRWTWERVAESGSTIEESYWRQTPVFRVSEDRADLEFAIRQLIAVGRARHALPLASQSAEQVQLPAELLIELLWKAMSPPPVEDDATGSSTMFQYYIKEILQRLDARPEVDPTTLIKLEWAYLPLLEDSRRPPKVLLRAISEQPALFVDLLKMVFRPAEDSDVRDEEPDDPERARDVATRAFRLLELCDRLPGTREDGSIDGEALAAWTQQVRTLAKAAGRADIADRRIGILLSASPMGTDGHWPAEAVRDVLDRFRSDAMLSGFHVGKGNRRGVTTRAMGEGGELERQEAAKYRAWAQAISPDHPYTAKALDALADGYEAEARGNDERAERLDWH